MNTRNQPTWGSALLFCLIIAALVTVGCLLSKAHGMNPAVSARTEQSINRSVTFEGNGLGWLTVDGDRTEDEPNNVYRPEYTCIKVVYYKPVVREVYPGNWEITFRAGDSRNLIH